MTRINFVVKTDTGDALKELAKVESKLQKLKEATRNDAARKDELEAQYRDYGARLDDAIVKVRELKAALDNVKRTKAPESERLQLTDDLREAQEEQRALTSQVNKIGSEYERVKARIAANTEEMKKQQGEADRLKETVKRNQFGDAIRSATVSIRGGFKTVLKYAFGIRSLFVLANRLRNALVGAVKAGTKEFIQFSAEANGSYTKIENGFKKVTASVTAAFIPILNAIAPIVERICDWLAAAAERVGKFIAALTGQKTYQRAIANQNAYTKAVDKSAKSAKTLQENLTGLDEMNTASSKESNSASADSNASIAGVETVSIDDETLKRASMLADAFERIRDRVGELKKHFDELNKSTGGLAKLVVVIYAIGAVIALLTGSWLPLVIAAVVAAVLAITKYVIDNWDKIKQFFGDMWDAIKAKFAEGAEELRADWENIKATFTAAFEVLKTKLAATWADVKIKAKDCWELLKASWQSVKDFGSGIIDWFKGLGRSIINSIIGAINGGLNKINGFIESINKISVAGFSPSIPLIRAIPELARGGVVKSRTLATIGEAGAEAVVPLERNAGWIIDLARRLADVLTPSILDGLQIPDIARGAEIPRNAVSNGGSYDEVISAIDRLASALSGGRGGSYEFIANLNRNTLFREIIAEGQLQKRRDGRNPFSLA